VQYAQQHAPQQYVAYPGEQKTASSYYLGIVSIILVFIGAIPGMICGAVTVWLAGKQLALGMPKAKTGQLLGKAAVVIGAWVMVIIVIIITW
jgi:hypothetical protein